MQLPLNISISSCLNMARWLLTRLGVFYVVIYALSQFVINYDELIARADLANLNRFMPDFQYYAEVRKGGAPFREDEVQKYLAYYQKVTEYMNKRADAHGMVGYSHYLLGEYGKAVEAYQKAALINPRFFWFHYNLGVLYFKQKEYQKAVDALSHAVAASPQEAIAFITASQRIYLPVLFNTSRDVQGLLSSEIERDYYNAYVMLILSFERLGEFDNVVRVMQQAVSKGGYAREYVFYYYAAKALIKANHPERAVPLLKTAIELDPKRPEGYIEMAGALSALGKPELGIMFERQAEAAAHGQPLPLVREHQIQLGMF